MESEHIIRLGQASSVESVLSGIKKEDKVEKRSNIKKTVVCIKGRNKSKEVSGYKSWSNSQVKHQRSKMHPVGFEPTHQLR